VSSPAKLFIRHATPTLLADRQFLALEENVKFNVFASALVFPRVSTTFQPCEPPVLFSTKIARKLLLKLVVQRLLNAAERGELK
jgi:hypothetical protein